MVADTLARLTRGGRTRRIAFVALVALMVTIAGCGGAGPANNTTGTDGAVGEETTVAGEETTVGNDTAGVGNETTEGVGNETTTAGNETTTGNDTGTANIRVAHVSPDAPNVDVYVNGEAFLTDVAYGNISEYTEVPAGEYNVSITEAGNESNVVFAENLTVDSMNYTVAATGEVGENATEPFSVLVLEDGTMDEMTDSTDTNASSNASVRIVHASPDAGEVSVRVADTDTYLAENVTFGTATEYVEVPAGDYSLEIVPANDTETVVSTVDVTLNESTPYTAFAAGYVSVDEAPADTPFEVFLAIDDPALSMDDTIAGNETSSEDSTTTEENTTESVSAATLFA